MRKLIFLLVVAVLAISAVAQASYQSGSCSGSFSVSYSGANFVTGLGWSTGSNRTISFSGSGSGLSWGPGVYGWFRNPLVEYYIGNNGGSGSCGYSCNGRSYTLRTATRYNAPSIDGTQTFTQYLAGGSRSSPVDMGCHFNAWRNCGRSVGNQAYQVVMVEGWSHNSGSASVSVSGSNWYTHWVGSGSATFHCGGGGGSTTTTTSGGGSTTTTSGGGSCLMELRARSTDGQGKLRLVVGGNTVGDWTFGTSMSTKSVRLWSSHGDCYVQFYNDASGRDCQVDYLRVCGSTRQAESQSYNTAVWENGSCGGDYSEWMHCNGIIGFGTVSY